MKKVYQEIVDIDRGDCMRAVIASLLELPLEAIPNFIDHGNKYYSLMRRLLLMYGYHPSFMWEKKYSGGILTLPEIAHFDGGIDGYFYASVPSQTFNCGHAVVVDKNMNVVHDPNPNQKALDTPSEEVRSIIVVNDFYIKEGRFVKGEDYKEPTGIYAI